MTVADWSEIDRRAHEIADRVSKMMLEAVESLEKLHVVDRPPIKELIVTLEKARALAERAAKPAENKKEPGPTLDDVRALIEKMRSKNASSQIS